MRAFMLFFGFLLRVLEVRTGQWGIGSEIVNYVKYEICNTKYVHNFT